MDTPSIPLSALCPPRGACQNPDCLGDPRGSCAFFEVTDNNVHRAVRRVPSRACLLSIKKILLVQGALNPQELCGQCDHPWYQHQTQNPNGRGGCARSCCGGFYSVRLPLLPHPLPPHPHIPSFSPSRLCPGAGRQRVHVAFCCARMHPQEPLMYLGEFIPSVRHVSHAQ